MEAQTKNPTTDALIRIWNRASTFLEIMCFTVCTVGSEHLNNRRLPSIPMIEIVHVYRVLKSTTRLI